jgi:hypothetical protein
MELTVSLKSGKSKLWLRYGRLLSCSTTLANELFPVRGISQLLEVMAFDVTRVYAQRPTLVHEHVGIEQPGIIAELYKTTGEPKSLEVIQQQLQ